MEWELRGTFTSLEEMLSSLQIGEDEFQQECDENRLLDYIQFVANAIAFVNKKANDIHGRFYMADSTIAQAVSEQCLMIAERLNAEIILDDSEFFVQYKDDIATAIVEQNEDCSVSIVEYLKIDNRGDLTRKGEILCTLAKKLEAYEKKFNGTEFSSLRTDTKALLNNIGPRHYLEDNNHIKRKAMKMSATELEEWYDRVFQMILACLAVVPYLDIKNEIKELKRDDWSINM